MKRIQTRIIVGALALAMLTCAAAAQNRTPARLVELNAAISQKAGNGQGQFDNAFRRMAAERRELMSKLAETDPAAAMKSILPAETLDKMPADVADMFERRGSFSGELVVEAECEQHNYRTHRYIKSGDSSKQLYLDTDPATEMKTGDTVTVEGYELNGKILASGDQAAVTTAASLTATTGEKRVLVILVNFQDKQTQPFTTDHARNVTFDQTSSYFRENSYGQTWLTGDVHGWYTIPLSSTSCDVARIASYAEQAAAAAGVDVSAYPHKIYGFPRISACGFSGSGSVGGNPSQAWINSDRFGLEVVGHEFGHNLGLDHSRSLDCGANVVGTNCTSNEYGDSFDLMGAAIPAHVNLFQKERLGWVNTGSMPTVTTVTSSGLYRIEPYSIFGTSPKGLKLLRSTDPTTGRRTWYYVEHRAPSGFDASLANYNVQSGVVVHSGSESSGSEIYLLDMTPATAEATDGYLAAGRSFSDPASGVTMTTISADSTGAWVQIDIPSQGCSRANPSVGITPGQSSWMGKGSTFTYSVSVTNNNSGGCANETFNLAASIPSGLAGSLSIQSLTLPNGGTGTATINVTSYSTTPDGTYNLGVSAINAANSGYARTASASYVLVSALGIVATPGSAKYSRSQTATVSSMISAAGAPVAGASVTFTMTKPSGSTVTQTVSSGSDGRAIFSYKFDRKQDPTGVYTVRASANANGYSGQAATSFSVTK